MFETNSMSHDLYAGLYGLDHQLRQVPLRISYYYRHINSPTESNERYTTLRHSQILRRSPLYTACRRGAKLPKHTNSPSLLTSLPFGSKDHPNTSTLLPNASASSIGHSLPTSFSSNEDLSGSTSVYTRTSTKILRGVHNLKHLKIVTSDHDLRLRIQRSVLRILRRSPPTSVQPSLISWTRPRWRLSPTCHSLSNSTLLNYIYRP
ncbi:hypothetical protein HBI75_050450 [Parastagonospora nodorum]|nr:hypothetical protein HBI75_050450 [Parastagonospora nodorum]KAH5482881.1 hypothetical protein HBI28_009940 [Parastagonospora nodorum]KAH5648175.1 hypothetical protein HBI22_013550 [Parastagonospora nodorum]KAH5683208.1 hypothetical protein HBI21_039250 [Parastagonospora nodorum]